ncbi:hypothetical protein DSCO28_73090 (plasmid) [Desulfosarcina ovata subsp. sediminis]|uniref:Uncharacterized protein n=1 Tax=Desulfosarcina ovata subsp. sediminis TaxID=885957 RepID=A0A5K8A2G8_9BACT|nr:hypothetical protein [Desulfosarcina ovata]BBO86743.1 hypothetical protein DSCO28_73090 [Desulfosarcina ovata subsp. sediminis]
MAENIRYKGLPVFFEIEDAVFRNGFSIRDCIVRRDNFAPVDRFEMFFGGNSWIAWTGDTISNDLKALRKRIAKLI